MKGLLRYRKVGLAIGILCGFSFGTASILIRFLSSLHSVTIVFMRFIIAFLILFSFLFLNENMGDLLKFLQTHTKIGVIMGVLLSLHFITFTQAVKTTTIMAATILVNTVPIQTAILGSIFFDLKVTKSEIIAITLGFTGVSIIFFSGIEFKGSLLGNLEALIAATFVALYTNFGREIREKQTTETVMTSNFLFGSITTPIISFLVPVIPPIQLSYTPYTLSLLLLLGLIPTAIGHSLFIASVRVLKPHEIATLALLEPASATVLALILFNEIPSLTSLGGAVLIGIAVYILFIKRSTPSK